MNKEFYHDYLEHYIKYANELIRQEEINEDFPSKNLFLSEEEYKRLKKNPKQAELSKPQIVALFHYTDRMHILLRYSRRERMEIMENFQELKKKKDAGFDLNHTEQYIFQKNKNIINKLSLKTPEKLKYYKKITQ